VVVHERQPRGAGGLGGLTCSGQLVGDRLRATVDVEDRKVEAELHQVLSLLVRWCWVGWLRCAGRSNGSGAEAVLRPDTRTEPSGGRSEPQGDPRPSISSITSPGAARAGRRPRGGSPERGSC